MADMAELMVRGEAAEKGKSVGPGETFDHAGRSWVKTMKGDVIPQGLATGAPSGTSALKGRMDANYVSPGLQGESSRQRDDANYISDRVPRRSDD